MMADDLPRARRVPPRGEDADDSTPARRRPPVGLIVAGAVVAGLLVIGGLVATTALLTGRRTVERAAAGRARADAESPRDDAVTAVARAVADASKATAGDKPKPAAKVRELDEAALADLEKAHETNPIVAREQLDSVRYRIRSVRISDFDSGGLVSVGCQTIRYGFTVRFRNDILRQLKRGEVMDIEATCTTFELYGHVWHIAFGDAIQIK